MAHVTAVVARKGGVGKSMISFNLAAVVADVQPARPDGTPAAMLGSIDPQSTSLYRAALLGSMPFDVVDLTKKNRVQVRGNLRALPHRNVFVDTPGWHELVGDDEDLEPGAPRPVPADPLGDSPSSLMLKSVLSQAHDAIVPISTERDSYRPTYETIEYVLKPLGIPFQVVINNWPPSEGQVYVDETRAFCARYGWPVARTVIRRYRVHTNAEDVCTRYKPSRLNLQAREDFYRLAYEHGLPGGGDRLAEIVHQAQHAPADEAVQA